MVAHFHYVLSMGAVFGVFGGLVHWFTLFTGCLLDSRILVYQFCILFLGVNLTFFPQHFLGLGGIPRRYSDYPDTYLFWNNVSSFGSYISLFSFMYFLFILREGLISRRLSCFAKEIESSLEWGRDIPPAEHTFEELPLLSSY